MKKIGFKALLLLCLAACALSADSLNVRMIDWLDAPGLTFNPTVHGYPGTSYWDLAMGDSVLVWVYGNATIKYLDPYCSDSIAIFYTDSGHMTVNAYGAAIKDTLTFVAAQSLVISYDFSDSIAWTIDALYTPFADYHYAVIEDTFLYTANFGNGDLVCINVADPESIFVYRTCPYSAGSCGLVAIDGYTYVSGVGMETIPGYPYIERPYWFIGRIDMINSGTVIPDTSYHYDNRKPGYADGNDSLVFWVNTEMADDTADFAIGYSHIGVWERDYSYTFSDFNGEMAFDITVLNDDWIAVGFESGFSILSIKDLDSIHEVAYYRDPDSTFNLTHFAIKQNRLYTMGHPRDDYARLYMFELDDTLFSPIVDNQSGVLPYLYDISAYPNPFNSAVTISVETCHDTSLQIEIFDINGRTVANIPVGSRPASTAGNAGVAPTNEIVVWQPDESLGSGVYLVRLKGTTAATKIIYMK